MLSHVTLITCMLFQVLRNLGKADRTRDDELEQHVLSFNDQQVAPYVTLL